MYSLYSEGDFRDGVLYKEVFNTLFAIQRLHCKYNYLFPGRRQL